jgi:hypothetical protein
LSGARQRQWVTCPTFFDSFGLVDVVEEDVVDDELVVVEAGIVGGTASVMN